MMNLADMMILLLLFRGDPLLAPESLGEPGARQEKKSKKCPCGLGLPHFVDVFSPFLWQWMFIYAAIIVVAGQLFWFVGLKSTKAADVSLVNSFTPIFGVFFAYLLLQEIPTFSQYLGGIIIILGIMLNQIGVNRLNREKLASFNLKEEDIKIGFKGI